MPTHSYKDTRGHLWVACCECTRGGNGKEADKCACGWKTKKWNHLGCFIGTLIKPLPTQKEKPNETKTKAIP
jgi:hypothetical protein